jgi:hypothetical protein
MVAAADAIDVVLRDGATARLRPASVEDRDRLLEFYRHLSPESRYFRFFGKPRVGDIVDDVVRDVASSETVTLVAEVDHRIRGDSSVLSDRGRTSGGRLRDRGCPPGAWHRDEAARAPRCIARSRGLTAFEAYVLRDNQKMRQVFVDSGFALTWDRADGPIRHVVFSLDESAERHEKETGAGPCGGTAPRCGRSSNLTPSRLSAQDAGEAASARRSSTMLWRQAFADAWFPSIRPAGRVEGVPAVGSVLEIAGGSVACGCCRSMRSRVRCRRRLRSRRASKRS